jgi:hypothetical protein
LNQCCKFLNSTSFEARKTDCTDMHDKPALTIISMAACRVGGATEAIIRGLAAARTSGHSGHAHASEVLAMAQQELKKERAAALKAASGARRPAAVPKIGRAGGVGRGYGGPGARALSPAFLAPGMITLLPDGIRDTADQS